MNRTEKPTLLVMAAGMGSRYGGTKQIDGFGPNGETIMDYSLFDALREGFGKVVFIVREEIRSAVEEMFMPRLEGRAEACCVVQSPDKFVPAQYVPVKRAKPWGTAHAMLCGKGVIDEPFAVINADDFYGRASFKSLADFLLNTSADHHAMVGYTLKDVLSEHGSVSRGVAEQGAWGLLASLSEVTEIVREGDKIVSNAGGKKKVLSPELKVSMNSWGFTPDVFPIIERLFAEFVESNTDNAKAEFYIGTPVTEMIRAGLGNVHIIPGGETWFGVTYREDREAVSKRIRALVEKGDYPTPLW